jgi:hypothetical protein
VKQGRYIYGFVNQYDEIKRLHLDIYVTQQRWEQVTIKYDPIEKRKAIFFSIYACLIPISSNEILIFGGDINMTRDDY